MSASENPYAPPRVHAEADPALQPGRKWHVSGEFLMVRHGAALPLVDLLAGDPRADLIPVSFVVRRNVQPQGPGAAAPALLRFRYYADRKSVRRQGRRYGISRSARRFGLVLFFGLLCSLLLGGPGGILSQEEIYLVLISLLGCLVIVGIAARRMTREMRPKPAGVEGEWVTLRNFHPAALEYLAQQQDRPEYEAAPVMRKVLVHPVHLARYPYRMLLRGRWTQPLFVLKMLNLKWSGGAAMDGFHLHYSMAEEIKPQEVSPELLALADPWLDPAAHGSLVPQPWVLLAARVQLHPGGGPMNEYLELASPGLEHFLHLRIITQAFCYSMQQFESFTFHTWLKDGSSAVTSTSPGSVRHPGVEILHLPGPASRAWQRHLSSLAGRPVAALSGPGEWRSRWDLWNTRLHAAYVAAGYESEPKEIEVAL